MEEMKGILGRQEILLAERCLETAVKLGADKARITLTKSLMELFGTLDDHHTYRAIVLMNE